MVIVIRCANCNGDRFDGSSVTVSVTLRKSEYCNHCHHGHEQKDDLFFCCMKCFSEYTQNPAKQELIAQRAKTLTDGPEFGREIPPAHPAEM